MSLKSKIPLFVLLTFLVSVHICRVSDRAKYSSFTKQRRNTVSRSDPRIEHKGFVSIRYGFKLINPQSSYVRRANKKIKKLLATRTSAARMANGKIVKISQYQLNSVRIGNTCEVGPVEVAVLPKGNNILGINTLLRVAPLTITPDAVILAGCE